VSTTSGAGNAPISNLDFLRSWWLAQQLQQQRGLSPHLLLQLQALQSLLAPRDRQGPLGLPMRLPSPRPLTLQQQLQAYAQQNPTLPFMERVNPGDRHEDLFLDSPLDRKFGHFPDLGDMPPLWKI